MSVRPYVSRYLGDCSLLFSKTWQLGRTWISDKNVPSGFLVSRRSHWRPKDSRPSVRPYVRLYVTLLLETRSLLFSETLQLVRACKCEKNVSIAFLKKIPFRPFWPKTSKIGHFGPKCPNMEVFRIFLAIS